MESYGEENIIAYCHATSRHSIAPRMSNYPPTPHPTPDSKIHAGAHFSCHVLVPIVPTNICNSMFRSHDCWGTTLFRRVRKIAESDY